MLNSLLRPSFLIPFALVTPYLFIGEVGVTWFEVLLITAFIIRVFKKGTIPRKPIIITYAILLLAGHFLAVVNADFNFGIPAKFGDLKVFYWLLLAFVGFDGGYRNSQDLGTIAQSRVFKLTLIVLGLFVASYPFLSEEIRQMTMRYYWPPGTDISSLRIYDNRFPGLGINSVIFAFMCLIPYCIAVKTALEKKISMIYPILGLALIIGCAGKTAFALALALGANLILFSPISRVKKVSFAIGSCAVLGSLIAFIFFTESGQSLQQDIELISRLERLSEHRASNQVDPVEDRVTAWTMGMERVGLAPFAGVARSPVSNDFNSVDFCCPHNEFIAYWTFTGFLGLLAYVLLISWMIIKSMRSTQTHFWLGLYLALCAQMFVDAAFQTTRFIPLMFLMIGLNLRELEIDRMRGKRSLLKPEPPQPFHLKH